MNDLKQIMGEIITESFPELMSEDIQIKYKKKLRDALLTYGKLKPEGFYIKVDKSLQNAPIKVIQGGIAHELAHILADKEFSIFARLKDILLYRISKAYRTLDERNTDLTAIIRGYGPELLAFFEYGEEKGFEHYKEDGLSKLELLAILGINSKSK